MLENFKEIYDRELENVEGPLDKLILMETDIRMFVYEICKNCIVSQPAVTRKPKSKEIWKWFAKRSANDNN